MTHLRKPHLQLELTSEELRKLGYAAIDEMVKHYDNIGRQTVTHTADRATMEKLLREPIPNRPTSPEAVLEQTIHDVFGNVMHNQHPRFFAFVPGPSNAVSAVADMLTAGFNAFAGTWLEASGAGMVEVLTIEWLLEMMGLPTDPGGGIFTSGGSTANLQALHVARYHACDTDDTNAVFYYSDQTHSSIDRATRIMGLRLEQVRRLPSDENYHINLDELRAAIAEDRAAGKIPVCVVANAGTTNTGAVDPLHALADLCAAENIWLHVDAAYGGAAVLTEQGAALLDGIGRAHSVTFDPHKWLFQPYEMGCLLVRDRRQLRDAFLLVPEYLADTDKGEENVNFFDYGVQLTRGFRALKLWMSLKVFGVDAFREAIAWGFEQGELAAQMIAENPRWQMVSGPQMGIVNFRYVPEGEWEGAALDDLQQDIVNEIVASGWAMIATTVLKGKKVIRLIFINPRTTEDEIHETIDRLAAIGERLAAERQHA
ncbi:MAG: aminotransferase class I/II-fold pyridoxal phosphate-dependent enzyme [Chloroflexota bacterium]